MRKRYRSPASAIGRHCHDHTRPSLYPDLYPARGRRNPSPSEPAAKRRRFSPERADSRSSLQYHYPTEEYQHSSPAEDFLKHRQSSQGSADTRSLSEYQYPARKRRKISLSKYAAVRRRSSQGSANIHPSTEYHYPAEEHLNYSPSEYTVKHRRFSQGKTDIHPSSEYPYPVEEARKPTASDEAVKRRNFGQGSDVFFPNQPHHSDASWRGPPPSEETRPEKSTSGEERQRGQRLFGNLTNALSRKQTDIAQKTREGRREQIELRQQAKLKAGSFLWESNRQRKRRAERHKMTEDTAKAFRERDAVSFFLFIRTCESLLTLHNLQMMARHAKNLVDARYLKTVTEPVLVYLDNKLPLPRFVHAS